MAEFLLKRCAVLAPVILLAALCATAAERKDVRILYDFEDVNEIA